jgi:hypothetical protein
MTNEQLIVVKDFFEQNKINCDQFATDDYCEFIVLRNENNIEDKNIVIVSTTIEGFNDNFVPVTETKNFFVEPNGNFYEMDMMTEVFRNNNEILTYIQGLTKFNWNGE